MTLSTTKRLMEPVLLDTKPLDASNLALSSGAAAASEYVSRYNDDLARKGSNIDKSIAQTMRRTLGRTNLVGSVIIESSEVMTAVSSADQRATFVQSFGVAGSVIGGLLGGAIFGILGAAASPVVGALAVGVGVGLGGFVGEELAEGVARSLFDFLDDDTDDQANGANAVPEAGENAVSEDVSSEMEVSQHVSIGFNDTLDFASIASDSEGLAETEENPAATPAHALVDPLTIQEGEAINPQGLNLRVIDRLSEILNQEDSLTTGAKQTFSPTYAGDVLFNEATSTSPTQTPTYANDYLENLNTLEPASSTRDVANDINDYIDEIAFDDPGFGAVQGSTVGRAETVDDISYGDPGYINVAFSDFDFSDTSAGDSAYGGDFDFDGYSDFDAGNDSGDDTWGGDADFGDGPGDSFLPVVLDLNGDGARILELNDSPAWFDFGEHGFVRRLAWADPNDAFLVYDADGDGIVNGPEELSFVGYLPGAATDLEGLGAFDSSGDGIISSDDIEWSRFAIWQDANSNGVTDEGELSALSDTNIASVTLASDQLVEDYEDGSRVFGRGMFTRTDNTTHDLADVALAVSGVAVGFNEDSGSIAFRSEALGRFEVAITNDSLDVSLDVDDIKAFVAGPNDDKIQSNGDHGVLVFGAAGDDTLTGSGANDWLFGGEGADSFEGNDGDDLLFVDAEDMYEGGVDGGPGVDIAVWDSASPALVEMSNPSFEGFIGSVSNDEVRVSGSAPMLVEGLAGDDLIFGGSGDDVLIGGAGADVLDAGAGDDWLFIDADDVSYSGGDGFDTLVVLDGHSVEINGRQKSIERFFGADGDDVVRNRFSRDSVEYFGGGGNDRLMGGAGDDYISGGTGNDKLDGGSGLDTAVFDAHAALCELNFVRRHTLKIEGSESSGQGRDRLKRFEIVEFADRSVRIDGEFSKAGRRQKVHTLSDGDDVLQGNQGSETVSANGGNDLVIAAGGDDVTNAGMGDDVVFGGAGQDRIRGEQGDDYLVGGAGDDVIEAGLGDDTVAGGEGDDWLSLGEGVDTALIFTKSGQDTLVLGSADAAERNVIEFVDASYEELWFERDGNNELRVSVLGTDDNLTVEDWFASESHASTIRDANGREVDAASVHHLITAMATFEASDSEPELASFYSSVETRSGSSSAYWELNSSLS